MRVRGMRCAHKRGSLERTGQTNFPEQHSDPRRVGAGQLHWRTILDPSFNLPRRASFQTQTQTKRNCSDSLWCKKVGSEQISKNLNPGLATPARDYITGISPGDDEFPSSRTNVQFLINFD